MPVLGLTGNLASGKSTVLKLLKAKGAIIFDADSRIHSYYRDKKSPVYKKVAASFPQCLKGRSISHRKLAGLVFSDRRKLKKLEAIVHPVIIKDLLKWVKERGTGKRKIYVAEVPLLFEKKLSGYFNSVVLIVAKQKVLIPRITKKYGFSKEEAVRRLSLYSPVREKIKSADFVVDNNSNSRQLKKEVDLLWRKIRQNQRVSR
jgi:dephospho-CoA kinase